MTDVRHEGAPASPVSAAAPTDPAPTRWRRSHGLLAAYIAIPVALGVAGLSLAQTSTQVDPITPVQVSQLGPTSIVSVKGQVSEIFGNKFVLQDGTGRALVELGRRGEGGGLVSVGEEVTMQGRFEQGFLRASALVRRDGAVETLGPAGGPTPGGLKGPPTGSLDWAKSKVGLQPTPDMPTITAALGGAGFTDISVIGSGPKHVDVKAKDASGRERRLHLGLDGRIKRDRTSG